MGRPPIGEHAMSNAEKQRRYRARKFGNSAPVTKPRAAPDEAAELRGKLARAEAVLAQAKVELAEAKARIVKVAPREEGRREPQISRGDLSMSAQQKLDTAIRQHKRKLDLEFDIRVRAELKQHLDSVALPYYAKELAKLERSIHDRRGIMNRFAYRKILSCLHPDRVSDPDLKKRYEEAFRLFTELEKRVLNEKESPTQFRTDIPRTYEELMKAKARVQAERRAKRAAKAGVSVR